MKKILSFAMASLLSLSALSFADVKCLEAKADSIYGNMYIDVVALPDGSYRADVMVENAPSFYAGGFHVDLGTSWKAATQIVGGDEKVIFNSDCILSDYDFGTYNSYLSESGNSVFIAFGGVNYNIDSNGRFASFYIEKTAAYDEDDNVINPEYRYYGPNQHDAIYSYLNTSSYTDIGPTLVNSSDFMLSATEYLRGDVDNDSTIDSADASQLVSAVGNNSYSVESIKYTFTQMFPNAKCAAVMDADENGIINRDDADAIFDYYVAIMNDETPDNNVGQIGVFEIYDN